MKNHNVKKQKTLKVTEINVALQGKKVIYTSF